jgi:hypothetical protein
MATVAFAPDSAADTERNAFQAGTPAVDPASAPVPILWPVSLGDVTKGLQPARMRP